MEWCLSVWCGVFDIVFYFLIWCGVMAFGMVLYGVVCSYLVYCCVVSVGMV